MANSGLYQNDSALTLPLLALRKLCTLLFVITYQGLEAYILSFSLASFHPPLGENQSQRGYRLGH